MKHLLLIFLFLLSSCSSYVQSIHKQIDNEERVKKTRLTRAQDRFKNQKPIRNPVILNGHPSANTQKNLPPGIKRRYNSKGTRRYRASDLVDNQDDGSLWSGKNSESFLFVNNSLKRQGDIVIIEVMQDFKEKIQEELKRAFPKRKKSKKKKEDTAETKKAATNDKPEGGNKVYDKISTVVMEQVNQDYLLVRGRKEIMYKKFKRYFEVQAIVSQKDISSRDSVSSVKLLEPKINVLRY